LTFSKFWFWSYWIKFCKSIWSCFCRYRRL